MHPGPEVLLQHLLAGERLPADGAADGGVRRVPPEVQLQVGGAGHGLPAHPAQHRLRPGRGGISSAAYPARGGAGAAAAAAVVPGQQVLLQRVQPVVAFPAQLAEVAVGPVGLVRPGVAVEGEAVDEGGPAGRGLAAVGPLLGVGDAHVTPQARAGLEGGRAQAAEEGPPVAVHVADVVDQAVALLERPPARLADVDDGGSSSGGGGGGGGAGGCSGGGGGSSGGSRFL